MFAGNTRGARDSSSSRAAPQISEFIQPSTERHLIALGLVISTGVGERSGLLLLPLLLHRGGSLSGLSSSSMGTNSVFTEQAVNKP